ncbi:MAG TPA: hypothetical protein VFQ36_09850 [Ktedonobacteraceae bacterium]|nr:hypothetical protein [Ktedonobacteraceae bacterium]
MLERSLKRVFPISSEQQASIFLALVAVIISIIVPMLQMIPSPYAIFIDPLIIIIGFVIIFLSSSFFSHKELIYGITDHLSVFNDLITSTVREHISIYYDVTPVLNLHTALLKIQNKGNTRIEKKDFHEKLMIVQLPSEIKLLSAAIKGKSRPNIAIDDPELTADGVAIKAFSLAAQEWFNIRFTFHFEDHELIEKLEDVEMKEGDEEGDGFGFNILKGDEWEKKLERRKVKYNMRLIVVLSILSVLSIAVWSYVWLFSGNVHFLPLQYQLLLTIFLTIPYFGLILSMFFNRTVPSSTT